LEEASAVELMAAIRESAARNEAQVSAKPDVLVREVAHSLQTRPPLYLMELQRLLWQQSSREFEEWMDSVTRHMGQAPRLRLTLRGVLSYPFLWLVYKMTWWQVRVSQEAFRQAAERWRQDREVLLETMRLLAAQVEQLRDERN
jgi:hypothetical protein